MPRTEDNLTKYIAIAVVVTVIAGISYAVNLISKPAPLVVSGDADFQLDADKLYREFINNEKAANKKFLNKIIAVEGVVEHISTLDTLHSTITLRGNKNFGVRAQFATSEDIKDIKPGDIIHIKGLCTGMLMDVVLVQCTIEKRSSL